MYLTQAGWIKKFKEKGALWIHDGNPDSPHPQLPFGMHSNGFFDSRLVTANKDLMHEAVFDLIHQLHGNKGKIGEVDCVVGPQTSATVLADIMSEKIASLTDKFCFYLSPAKHEEDGVKSIVLNEEEMLVLPGQTALLCEDVVTKLLSVQLAADAVKRAGGQVLNFVTVLLNRSGQKEIDGIRVISLIDIHLPIWTPEECPLCKQGSKAIPPKGNSW
jgi:orotate phosphoribosyltransferase